MKKAGIAKQPVIVLCKEADNLLGHNITHDLQLLFVCFLSAMPN